MSSRVPDTGPEIRERDQLARKLQADLRRFRNVPGYRREAECADEGEATCLALLRELSADGDDNLR